MRHRRRASYGFCAFCASLAILPLAVKAHAQSGGSADAPSNALPNPYKTVENWAKLPEGWTWGQTGVVTIDGAGHVWVSSAAVERPASGRPKIRSSNLIIPAS